MSSYSTDYCKQTGVPVFWSKTLWMRFLQGTTENCAYLRYIVYSIAITAGG